MRSGMQRGGARAAITANARRPSLGQLEREPGERRADEDREHGAGVDERDRRSRRVGTRALRRREDHGEGEARHEPEHERAERRERRVGHRARAGARPPTCRRVPPRRGDDRCTRPARTPPVGRVTMPTKRISPPARPAAVELAPWRSRSGTTQLPATTASPNVAACRIADRQERRGRGAPTRRRVRSAEGRSPASVGTAARIASSAALQYGRAPARRVGQRRHDHEREPAAGHGRAAVEALQRRPAASGAHEVEPGDERGARAEADDRPSDERELEARVDEQDGVPERRAAAIATSATLCEPKRSAPRPAGSWTARWVTKSAVVRSPTAASETP